MEDALQEAKTNLRRQIQSMIRCQEKENLNGKSGAVRQKLVPFLRDLLVSKFNQTEKMIIGAYAPLDDEVNWWDDFPYLGQVAFPAIDGEKMTFHHSHPRQLKEKEFFKKKFLVPATDLKTVVPDILIVPGVAFTKSGDRLGRGKGFYDRYLKSFHGPRIGICFDVQLVEKLPVNSRDEKVHYIVSESQLIDCSSDN